MNHSVDWKRKLSSRKLWLSLAAFVAGLVLAFGGSESVASTVSGCIMSGAAVLGYLLAEGLVDSADAASTAAASTMTAGKLAEMLEKE